MQNGTNDETTLNVSNLQRIPFPTQNLEGILSDIEYPERSNAIYREIQLYNHR